MVKIQYYLPESSDFSSLKQQLIQSGILDKTNESIYKMAPEAVDPAILSRGSLSYRRYTKSALLLLRDDVLSRCKPNCAKNPRLISLTIWKVQPLYSKQNSRSGNSGSRNFKNTNNRHVGGSSSIAITSSNNQTSHHSDNQNTSSSDLLPAFMKRRMICSSSSITTNATTSDTKEEFEKDQEAGFLINAPKEELAYQIPPTSNQERETTLRDRRIGSGRLLPRNLKSDLSFDLVGDPGYKASSNTACSINEFRKYGRPEYDRDSTRENLSNKYSFNSNSESLTSGDSNELNHHHRQRRCSQPILEEPEWYTAGPTSKHDTIELRGFDENEDAHYYESLKAPGNLYKSDELQELEGDSEQKRGSCKHLISGIQTLQSNNALEVPDESGAVLSGNLSPPARSTPTKFRDNISGNKDEIQNNEVKSTTGSELNENQEKQIEQNVNGILKEDSFHNLSNEQKKPEISTSGFSHWFKKDDHTQKTTGHRISFYENRNNMGNEPQNKHNGAVETGKYFPQSSSTCNEQGTTFLEFLQKDKFNEARRSAGRNMMWNMDKQKAGMISNVEELEARMRENGVGFKTNYFKSNVNSQHVPPTTNVTGTTSMHGHHQKDIKAFKKILERLIPGVANPVGMNVLTAALYQNQQPQILQQMINRSKQEEIKKAILQQQQQCNFQMRVNDLLLKIANKQVTWNDVLKRPEAYAVLRGLARGDYTEAALLQQISSPNVTARYREVIITILNYLNQNTRVASSGLGMQQMFSQIPAQQQMHFQQVQGQQQVQDNTKPGPPKIPSPRELQYHTQLIMQSALIKKKLEQQQENLRYRQELQKQQQYHQGLLQHGINPLKEDSFHFARNSAHAYKQQSQNNLSTPLTFTPTSVLRKMTGEKDNILASTMGTAVAAENGKFTNKVMQSLSMTDTGNQQQEVDCPRMILGGGNNAQMHMLQNQEKFTEITRKVSQQNNNPEENVKDNSMKYNAGRPILKGNFMPLQSSSSSSRYVQEKSQVLDPANGNIQSTSILQQVDDLPKPNAGNNSTEANALNECQRNDDGTPTDANELARWFSPELLARATAGQLPSINVEQTLSSKDVEQTIQNSSAHI